MIDLTFDPAFHADLRRAMKRYGYEPESEDDRIARRLLAAPEEPRENHDADVHQRAGADA